MYKLEAYTIGTAVITGTTAALLHTEATVQGKQAARLALLTALSGGLTTLLAWGIDKYLDMRGCIAYQAELRSALDELQPERNQRMDWECRG